LREFEKPKVIVSKCIGFEACRYDGQIIRSNFVDNLRNHVEFYPICPEVEIGLGVPRDSIRIIKESKSRELKLVQPATGRDLTKKMINFSNTFLNSINDVDGFILKNKSPSCGIKNVKLYNETIKSTFSVGFGFFGKQVLEKFPNLAIEDEGRLRSFEIREAFLTKLFTLAKFHRIKNREELSDIIDFHAENKFLFMSYDQNFSTEMGKLIANQNRTNFKDLIRKYEEFLTLIFSKSPIRSSNINVMLHSLGYFKKDLSREEKSFFLDSLRKYDEGSIPMMVNLNILKSWIIRFKLDYLAKQTFFEPYPEELLQITCLYK
jgi:uncharacterized protein YbgA (DUF1722 family)/uncharacterized protein YbbK (DUF523 family)